MQKLLASALTALLATTVSSPLMAQQPVYMCNGTYTDKPCKDGKEIDIAPTRGAHSMSGVRRESHEASMEGISRDIREGQAKGSQQASQIFRCADLQRQRKAIDASGSTDAGVAEQRFKIREEQFQLKCKQT